MNRNGLRERELCPGHWWERIYNFLPYALAARKKISIEAIVIRFKSPNRVALEIWLVCLSNEAFFFLSLSGWQGQGVWRARLFPSQGGKVETDLLEKLAHSTIVHLAFDKGIHLTQTMSYPTFSFEISYPRRRSFLPHPRFYTKQSYRFWGKRWSE